MTIMNIYNLNGSILHSRAITYTTNIPIGVGLVVEEAVAKKIDLSNAQLSGASFRLLDLSDAQLRGANLTGANFAFCDLSDANLSGAIINGANFLHANLHNVPLIDGGLRYDGYRFFLTNFADEGLMIRAGCHNFNLEEAYVHWAARRIDGLHDNESIVIICHMLTIARARGWDIPACQFDRLK